MKTVSMYHVDNRIVIMLESVTGSTPLKVLTGFESGHGVDYEAVAVFPADRKQCAVAVMEAVHNALQK